MPFGGLLSASLPPLAVMSISSWSAPAGIPVQLHAHEVRFMHVRVMKELELKHGKFGLAKSLHKYVHNPSSDITIHADWVLLQKKSNNKAPFYLLLE